MLFMRLAFWSVRVLGRLFFTAVLLGGIGLVVYTCFWLPPVSFLADENPDTTAFIERTREVLRKEGRNPAIRQRWVPLDNISPELVKAVRIAEDDRFFMHNGFDFTEIPKRDGDQHSGEEVGSRRKHPLATAREELVSLFRKDSLPQVRRDAADLESWSRLSLKSGFWRSI